MIKKASKYSLFFVYTIFIIKMSIMNKLDKIIQENINLLIEDTTNYNIYNSIYQLCEKNNTNNMILQEQHIDRIITESIDDYLLQEISWDNAWNKIKKGGRKVWDYVNRTVNDLNDENERKRFTQRLQNKWGNAVDRGFNKWLGVNVAD